MAIGVGFANDEYDEKSIEDYYEEELADAPMGPGFVSDICYKRAIERYEADHTETKTATKRLGRDWYDDHTARYRKRKNIYWLVKIEQHD